MEAEQRNNNLPQAANDDDTKALEEFSLPVLDKLHSSILRPPIEANSFELKPVMFQMLQIVGQCAGLEHEDPHTHLLNFIAICDSFKMNQVFEEAIQLRLFPYSLAINTRLWLNSQTPNSITTWD